MNDFNGNPAEYTQNTAEYNASSEYAPFEGNPAAKELNAFEGSVKNTRRAKKSCGGRGRMQGLCVTAVVAVAAASVIVPPPQGINAEIAAAEATDTTVSYIIYVDSDESLDAVLYNDFTRRSFPLERGENRNVFADLRADTEYTLAIVGNFGFGDSTVAERTVKTAAAPDSVTERRDRVVLHCIYYS